ncbi:hypothetical protein [Mucilaginibacter aquaedulcis]|uniref:hypothetical protein n=1 Tax=Mucilaginibacter aquaedulcis TaxID=1187081 RepID=UPI0025B3C395|nr:hypothetical protein [Mucilaginibacter aquaedulcis]MDN3546875.1 hypothetical protein [Mucilaginibacter aquaedulcis]
MNNKPATQVAVIAVFFQIALQFVFLYISPDTFRLNPYIRYILSGLATLIYPLILIFLLSVLKFFHEKNNIITALTIYIAFTVLYNILNITAGFWGTSLVTYYSVANGIHFLMELYLVATLFMVKHPVIRSGFILFAVLLLVSSITVLVLPMLFGMLNISFELFRYIYLVNVLPLIAAIIIFNKTAEGTKNVDFTSEKPLFKDEPF